MEEFLEPAVLEALAPAWSPETPHAVYRLSKTGLTTPEAEQQVARALRVAAGQVHAAGLKDKHAATAQHISVHAHAAAQAGALPQSREHTRGPDAPGWRIRLLGWHAQPLQAACIARNAFQITVRGLRPDSYQRMQRRAEALTLPGDEAGTLLLPNYFGDQRFGSVRHGKGFAAVPLLRGDTLGALRLLVGTPARKDMGRTRAFTRLCAQAWGQWPQLARDLPACPERAPFEALARGATPEQAFRTLPRFLQLFCLEAFQSAVWNQTVARLVRSAAAHGSNAHDAAWSVQSPAGELWFSPAAAWSAAHQQQMLPLLASSVPLQPPWGPHAVEALAEHGLTVEELQVPQEVGVHLGTALRPAVCVVRAFSLSQPVADERSATADQKSIVRFELPRGSYATVVLRALGE